MNGGISQSGQVGDGDAGGDSDGDARAFDPAYTPDDPYRVDPDGIPPEMFDGDGFLWVEDAEKGKVPKQVGNPRANAKSNEAATWGSFGDAVAAAASHDERGVGYSLAQDTPLVAIDLDVPAGGAWVPDLHALGGATAEYSPSGNLRVYLRDVDTPEWWTNLSDGEKGGAECKLFDGAGYVTVTGDLVAGFDAEVGPTSQPVFEKWLKDAWRAFPDPDRAAHDDETPPWDPTQSALGDVGVGAGASAGDDYEGEEWLTGDDIRDALGCIDPNTNYDRWRNVGFALKSFFGDTAEALDVFCAWSRGEYRDDDATGPTGWDSRAGQLAEHIVRYADPDGNGGVTTGTIVKFARDGGWTLPDGVAETVADAGDGSWVRDYREWVQAASAGDTSPSQKQKRGAAARFITERREYMARWPRQDSPDKVGLWEYDPELGVFTDGAVGRLEAELTHLCEMLDFGDADRRAVVKNVRRRSFTDPETFDAGAYDDSLVAVANGVLNVEQGEFLDHSPAYRLRSRVPWAYDPDADCPAIDAFLTEVTGGDDVAKQTLYEWVGYCLVDGYPIHSFLLLYGDGGNGKGVFLDLLDTFLGEENVSNVGLSKITDDDRFSLAQLDGTLANLDRDIPGRTITTEQLTALKKLSAGEKKQAEHKGEEPFTLESSAKLAFAANEPPRFYEASESVGRRLLNIEFPRTFDGTDAEKSEAELHAELFTDTEMAGLLNRALDAVGDLLDRNAFTLQAATDRGERFAEYMGDADPILGFATSCVTERTGHALPKDAVYAAYKRYCAANGHEPTNPGAFWREFGKKAPFTPDEARVRTDAGRQRVEYGMWFTDAGVEYVSHEHAATTDAVMTAKRPANVASAERLLATVRDRERADTADTDRAGDADAAESVPADAVGVSAEADRLRNLLVRMTDDLDGDAVGVTTDDLRERASAEYGFAPDVTTDLLDRLSTLGEVYEPGPDCWRPT